MEQEKPITPNTAFTSLQSLVSLLNTAKPTQQSQYKFCLLTFESATTWKQIHVRKYKHARFLVRPPPTPVACSQ
jgi:hypothetical protein